jgi:hypothetical protein
MRLSEQRLLMSDPYGKMQRRNIMKKNMVLIAVFVAVLLLLPHVAVAHCDTLDGPVVMAARAALEKGDVTPVLKWVMPDHEGEIRTAFKKTIAVRSKGPESKELADMYFFETLVRVHRAGEGAPYTGLKPAGADLGPAVAGADKALETGDIDDLAKLVAEDVSAGIHKRFHHAFEAKKRAEDSVEAGREFVQAYVEFVHYVERLHNDAVTSAIHHGGSMEAVSEEHHGH